MAGDKLGEIVMQELKAKINNLNEKYILISLFILALIMRILTLYADLSAVGIGYGGDVIRFSAWAEEIKVNGLGYFLENIDKPYYWGYPTILYLCRTIFKSDISALILNIIATSAATVLLYKTAVMATENRCIGLLSSVMYAYSPQLINWNAALTSDALGIFFVILCFYFYYKQKDENGAKKKITIAFLIISELLFFLIRTTAVIAILYITFGLIKQLDRKRRIISLSIILLLGISVLTFLFATSYGEHGLAERAKYYISLFESGTIVYETNTFIYPVHESFIGNWLFLFDIIGIVICRFIFFWAVSFDYYTIVDNLMGYGLLLPVFITSFIGIVFAIKNKHERLLSMVGFILMTNIIQSFFEIDGGYRYRLPVLPYVLILSSYCIYCIFKLYYKNQRKDVI